MLFILKPVRGGVWTASSKAASLLFQCKVLGFFFSQSSFITTTGSFTLTFTHCIFFMPFSSEPCSLQRSLQPEIKVISNHHTQPECYAALKHAGPSELAQCFLYQPHLNSQAVGKRQIVCLTNCKVKEGPILNTVFIPIRNLKHALLSVF